MMGNKSFTKDDKQNYLLVLLSAILFYTNEAIKFKIKTPYLGYILRCYFNDFLGGLSFMALLNIILYFSKYNKIKQLRFNLLLGIMCSIFWEIIAPTFITHSTGDFWDGVAYCLGFTIYWMVKRFGNRDKTYII